MSVDLAASAAAGPLRVVAVGAGQMGRAWLRVLEDSAEVELVGLADLDLDVARQAATELGRADLATAADGVALARDVGAAALVDVTVPVAHHPVTTAALFAGLPVLGEKPAAATLAQTLSLAAAAECSGQLFMVSQSRRWNPQLAALKSLVSQLGPVGAVATEFYRGPHFGGFRDAMAQPLLVDMAIHQFDAARYLLESEPLSVSCETWNPGWSWYTGDASATAVFEFDDGARYSFSGSWCAPGAETSWNGEWRVSAARGTALWSGDDAPTVDVPVADAEPAPEPGEPSPYDGIAGSLAIFCAALRSGETPMGEVHENAMSLAMVEAAVRSAELGRRVLLDDVLDDAHRQAVAEERRDDVRAVLTGWASVREALAGWRG